MRFVYGKQDMPDAVRAQENCWLLTNGLGGFASVTGAFSVTRSDHGLLIAARTAPNDRISLVHRLSEKLDGAMGEAFLSSQAFADGTCEDGWRHLSTFAWEHGPQWDYDVGGIHVTRRCAMGYGSNTVAVLYRLENRTDAPCTLTVTPGLQFAPKGSALQETKKFSWNRGIITSDGMRLHIKTDGKIQKLPTRWESLSYTRDAQDGRNASGLAAVCCRITMTAEPGVACEYEIIFSTDPIRTTGKKLLQDQKRRMKRLEKQGNFRHPIARQLAVAAADYISYRQSTDGMTILAGFPFFGDWGRDTMIALPGCVLARQDYDTAKSILRTFLAYEKDGLVPNLFPEGNAAPMYNTVDAAMLLINCIWLYHTQKPDPEFVREAWPVMKRIINAYRRGTHHGICMEKDGLISAGQGMDQVTWMDVCVEGILPTPRHGKPVEINAYWYNALQIMARLAPLCGEDGEVYAQMAEKTAESFRLKFWLEEGYLKDVISGTSADTQIRGNQIWAVTMPFTMLDADQERRIVDTVYRHLYTPCGLRTLSPEDPQFQPHYGGSQRQRDLAYHQGTVWPFPLGAYYLAYLKVNGYTEEAKHTVYQQLQSLESALGEGCIGQLPEIYEGLTPGASQGCFAQAWSVGELLRVYEALEKGNAHEIG
ncbi:MAG: glycogen debranching enzyme family protein [Oscillospiraceae bacterium]|nr:glycogen debranching enzyme family protein [Oscillospiraceae bacterium]